MLSRRCIECDVFFFAATDTISTPLCFQNTLWVQMTKIKKAWNFALGQFRNELTVRRWEVPCSVIRQFSQWKNSKRFYQTCKTDIDAKRILGTNSPNSSFAFLGKKISDLRVTLWQFLQKQVIKAGTSWGPLLPTKSIKERKNRNLLL